LGNEEKSAYLGLGSNLGDKKENIKKALRLIENHPDLALINYSSIYLTEAIGVKSQPDFYNAAVLINTKLSPQKLFETVKLIEQQLGRVPDSHFQPRPIDIDILLYDNLTLDSPLLVIPHPQLSKRAFVLIPLLELNPELIHPVSLKPLKEYLIDINPPQTVERIIDAGELFERA
jgi:2-amino-4-hydroxy-6-hydroxymethyldihydropteridine diphosphokinase